MNLTILLKRDVKTTDIGSIQRSDAAQSDENGEVSDSQVRWEYKRQLLKLHHLKSFPVLLQSEALIVATPSEFTIEQGITDFIESYHRHRRVSDARKTVEIEDGSDSSVLTGNTYSN